MNERDTSYYHSEYTPVPIFQRQWEWEHALKLYRHRNPFRVLEIGTYHGGTLYHWLRVAQQFKLYKPKHQLVVSVDSYRTGVDNRHLYPSWTPDGLTCVAIEGDSSAPETLAQVDAQGSGFYDWIFIDAGHRYHEVKADWENYLQRAAPCAAILFHDILPPSPEHPEIEVARLWAEIKAEYRTDEFIADPNACWGGIGVVYLP